MVHVTDTFYFGVLLFLFSNFSSYSAENQQYLDCAPQTCNLTRIQYPFTLTSRSSVSGCGLPGLGLSCDHNRTLLFNTSSGLGLRILDIDYAAYTIKLAIDYSLILNTSGCIYPKRNITLSDIIWGNPLLPLNFTSVDKTETFFYNCTNNIFAPSIPGDYSNPAGFPGYDFSSQFLPSCTSFSYAFFNESFTSMHGTVRHG